MERHIVTISGGGFSEETDAYIDNYIVRIKRKDSPIKICFVATASNDAQGYIDKFYSAFQHEEPAHLTIKDFSLPNIQAIVNAFDIVYIGGGHTQSMLKVWRSTNFDRVLINAYKQGVILAGISAGAMCWFEHCTSENSEQEYESFQGLGLLKGALCPHYNDPIRKQHFDEWAKKENLSPLYLLEDHENLHFINENCVAKIST